MNTDIIKKTMRKPVFMLLSFVVAQNIALAQKPLAQYPMETEGKKVLRLYDVSGNGWHGRLDNRSAKPISAIFEGDEFPNDVSCIRKLTTDNATISMPPFYRNHDLTRSGFALTCWVYVDNSKNTSIVSASLVSVAAFSLIQLQDKPGVTNFALSYRVAGLPGVEYVRDATDFKATGWYFLSVAYDPNNNGIEPDVVFTSYSYDGHTYYPNLKRLVVDMHPSQKALSSETTNSQQRGFLLDGDFKGKIWNVTFYDTYLSSAQINENRNDSWYLSAKDMTYDRNDRYYIVADVNDFYPCAGTSNNPVVKDVVGNRNSINVSNLSFTADRFGNANSAIRFGPQGYAALPLFYKTLNGSPGFDVRKGYTLSFWTYIEKYLFPPDDASIPFTNTDPAYQYIYLSTASGQIGGVESIRDRLVLDRYTALNPVRCWRLWLWDPVSFQNTKGWCHVIVSQKENAVRVVMYNAEGQKGCRLNYFNAQDFSQQFAVAFGFGVSPNSIGKDIACPYLDDVRIYNWPFSEKEAEMLHAFEKVKQ